ncbi:hypothetical protein PAU_01670 [Photorhabdus asymbiotica]|uniref:Uncharacterized protein n=1 Tax=Photorhabdus asymbiotica subsp. asymbiotica (strain ATCC 43949 / 3105-77) TaxID=553480 RepID=C7BSR8_PHOAA|nr:hypothetical protein PAU_01670 [Photorhabdus asymbiotica]
MRLLRSNFIPISTFDFIYVFLINEIGDNLIFVEFINNINAFCHDMLF